MPSHRALFAASGDAASEVTVAATPTRARVPNGRVVLDSGPIHGLLRLAPVDQGIIAPKSSLPPLPSDFADRHS